LGTRKVTGCGMEALEERARKRLELEEVRQKRVALELQLEARRKDAEAAQRRLAELSGKAAVARVPSEGGQVGAREGLGRAARARPVSSHPHAPRQKPVRCGTQRLPRPVPPTHTPG